MAYDDNVPSTSAAAEPVYSQHNSPIHGGRIEALVNGLPHEYREDLSYRGDELLEVSSLLHQGTTGREEKTLLLTEEELPVELRTLDKVYSLLSRPTSMEIEPSSHTSYNQAMDTMTDRNQYSAIDTLARLQDIDSTILPPLSKALFDKELMVGIFEEVN